MPFQCYLEKEGKKCGQTFESKRKLKEHVQPAPHKLLRVVCPFCTDKEVSYNRAADLKAHISKRHSEAANQTGVTLDALLSENNSYWIAMNPADYRAFVEPTERENKACVRLRTLILEWSRRVKGPHRERDQWLKGWEEPPKNIPFVQSRPVPTTSTADEYDPSQPELKRMKIVSISLLPGAISAILEGDSKRYKCQLDDGLLLDSKSVTSITRKLAFLMPCEEENCGQFIQQADDIITRCISSTLGVDPRFILRVDVADLGVAVGSSDITEPELDLFAESDFDIGSPAPSERIVQIATPTYHPTPLESIVITPTSAEKTVQPIPHKEQTEKPTSPKKKKLESKPSPKLSKPEVPSSPKRKKTEDPPTEKEKRDEPKTKTTTSNEQTTLIPPTKNLEVISSCDTHSQSVISRKRPVCSIIKAVKKPATASKGSPTPAGDCSTVGRNQGSLQDRARNLLARGCLPIMPPARRQWAEKQVTITHESASIKWPPTNWKDLSKDQRLLELEYAAMTLTRAGSNNHHLVERAELLEEFNFLALPGTIPLSPKKLQKAHLKSRVYMYQAIRSIAVSDVTSVSDEELVSFLEGACHRRRRTWDHLISVVDAAGIPLRLKEEN